MGGDILDWQNRAIFDLPQTWHRAYSKLVGNLRSIQLPIEPARKKKFVFVASLPLHEDSIIWQFEMTREQRLQRWLPGELMQSARQAFQFTKGLLSHLFHSEPPANLVLTQLVATPNRRVDATRYPFAILGSVFDPVGQTVQYLWRDGTELFTTDTRHLRIMQSPAHHDLHIGPHRWTVELAWFPQQSALWIPLWKDYRSAVENCFLWQLTYRIPATNHWRFPLAGQE